MALNVFFVTGTGTDVGKTYIASRWAETRRAAGQRVGVYKPVASGCVLDENGTLIAEDAQRLWQAAGRPLDLHSVCPQRFSLAAAPPEAAAAEGKRVDEAALLKGLEPWFGQQPPPAMGLSSPPPLDVLLVEGAGGLFSPMSDALLNIDFGLRLQERFPQLKVVLVARNRLGVIHDCVATVRAAAADGLAIDQIVLNQIDAHAESTRGNAEQIERWTGVETASA